MIYIYTVVFIGYFSTSSTNTLLAAGKANNGPSVRQANSIGLHLGWYQGRHWVQVAWSNQSMTLRMPTALSQKALEVWHDSFWASISVHQYPLVSIGIHQYPSVSYVAQVVLSLLQPQLQPRGAQRCCYFVCGLFLNRFCW